MAIEDCRAAVEAAGGQPVSIEQLTDMWEELQARAENIRRDRPSLSQTALIKQAADDMAAEALMAARIEMRNAKLNLTKRIRRRGQIAEMAKQLGGQRGADLALAIEAKLVGINSAVRGARLSVDAQGVALARLWAGGLTTEMEKAGLFNGVKSGKLDRAIARELWALSKGEAPGSSGSKAAQKAAGIIYRYQRLSVEAMNREGAWVGQVEGYITRQAHDADRMVSAGYQAWRDAIAPRLDERTFEGVTDREGFLHSVYNAVTTGVHLDADGLTGFKNPAFKGPSNLAKKLSAQRTLHFRDADAWMDYQQAFGARNLIESILRGLDKAARSTALMREYGTNPRAEFEADIQHLQETWRDKDRDAVTRLGNWTKALSNRMDELDGTAASPVNRVLARIGAGARTWQSLSKLGGVVLSALTDVPFKAGELRYQGINLLEGYADGITALTRGRGAGETREIMDLIGAGLEGAIGHMASRFDGGDHVPGQLSSLANTFFRWTGLTYWTDAQRAGAEIIMSRHLGGLKGQAWDALPAETRRILSLFDIRAEEWQALDSVEWAQADGKAHLTPDRARLLSDDVVDGLIQDQVEQIGRTFADRLAKMEAGLGRLETRLSLLDSRVEKAQNNPGRSADRAEIKGTVQGYQRGANAIRQIRDAIVQMRDGKLSVNSTLTIMRQQLDFARAANLEIGQRLERQRAKGEVKDAVDANMRVIGPAMVMEEEKKLLTLLDELSALPVRHEEELARARSDVREGLALKLASYFSDRGKYAVLEPGARERAILRQGTRAGTPEGEAVRTILQFKAFPVAMISKVWGREIYGGQVGQARAAGIIHMMVASTVFGYLAGAAKDIAKGRTPRDPKDPATWAAAFTQGGGAGIYGDFLVGKYNRFGNTALETAAGPTLSSVSDVVNLWSATRGGDGRAATGLRIALANTPFANLFYVRPAIDYLFLYQVQEALNPGFLRRMERRLKEENGQRFIIPPSTVVNGD